MQIKICISFFRKELGFSRHGKQICRDISHSSSAFTHSTKLSPQSPHSQLYLGWSDVTTRPHCPRSANKLRLKLARLNRSGQQKMTHLTTAHQCVQSTELWKRDFKQAQTSTPQATQVFSTSQEETPHCILPWPCSPKTGAPRLPTPEQNSGLVNFKCNVRLTPR